MTGAAVRSGGMGWVSQADRPRDDWETPPELFAELDREFGFELDPCCSRWTAKCREFYTLEDDGLSRDWAPRVVFMNPPYGRGIERWMRKARAEADRGATVACLVPLRADTRWWNETTHRSEIRVRYGRVNFVGGNAALPVPLALVVMRPDDPERPVPEVGSWRALR